MRTVAAQLPPAAVDAYLARLGSDARAAGAETGELTAAVAAACQAWPQLSLEAVRFADYLGARAAKVPPGAKGRLAGLALGDLYLAWACIEGQRSALAAFGALLDEVGRKLRKMESQRSSIDDAKQIIGQVLIPRADGTVPLADYGGRGDLGGWLRIAMTRQLARLAQKGRREVPASDDELRAVVDDGDDPEVGYLKTHYQVEFRAAFTRAMEALTDAERRLLRYSIIERLSIDDIAKLDGVHRATAARQVTRARARLIDETKRVLGEQLRIAPDELRSVLRLIESRVDVSVRRLLAR